MAASQKTVGEALIVLKKHVPADHVEGLLTDLLHVKGNTSFETTVLDLAKAHAFGGNATDNFRALFDKE